MDSEYWWSGTNPGLLLVCVDGRHKRKCLLFGVACCRRVWSLIPDEASRRVVMVAERHADGEATARQIALALKRSEDVSGAAPNPDAAAAAYFLLYHNEPEFWAVGASTCGRLAAQGAARCVMGLGTTPESELSDSARAEYETILTLEQGEQSKLLRDIFPDPYSSVTLDPSWLTPAVVALATGIYTEKAFDRMAVLADALEEAGCDDAAVLEHCRGDGVHVRGCWLIDTILGKE